jgi:putative ABC transport system permease protein
LRQDIRYALRIWRHNPLPTIASFVALALAIGASAAIFSVVNAVLLRPLPVKDPDRIVRIFESETRRQTDAVSMQDVADWKKHLHSFESLAFYRPGLANMSWAGNAVLVATLQCDAELFEVLGVRPARGRAFTADDNRPGHDQAILLSWAFWQSQFGGEDVIGRTLQIDDKPRTIAGVLPEDLNILGHKDVWMPAVLDFSNRQNMRGYHSYLALGRLRSDITLAQGNAELGKEAANLATAYPAENQGVGASAISLRTWLSGDLKGPLVLLLGAVLCVLLIACGNVANLLLARTSARMREVSTRLAIGASRARIFSQLMTESFVLAAAAALTGVAIAAGAIRVVKHLPSTRIPRPEEITLDWRVLAFAVCLTGITAMLFGLVPAFRTSTAAMSEALKQANGRISESKGQQWMRRTLVAVETAVATLLLIVSVLLLKSFEKAAGVDPGFQPDRVMSMYTSLPPARYGQDSELGARFADRVLERVRALPGIESAAFTGDLPFTSRLGGGPIVIKDKVAPKNIWNAPFVLRTAITSGYCKTLRIPLIEGRDLDRRDDAPAAKAVLVNEAFARQFFPGEEAVGRFLSYVPGAPDWHQVVGVVNDARQQGAEAPILPQLYIPLYRYVELWPALVVRTAGDPLGYAKSLQDEIKSVDPEVPIFLPRSMRQIMAEQLGWRTVHTSLISLFAAVALTLSAIGIYAVIAYSVTQRISEIGVRMACGAGRPQILRMIVKQGMAPALAGTLAGAAAALATAKLFSRLLYGVRFTDYSAYLSAIVFLVLIAAAASYFPARRAAAINPWQALRHE